MGYRLYYLYKKYNQISILSCTEEEPPLANFHTETLPLERNLLNSAKQLFEQLIRISTNRVSEAEGVPNILRRVY